MTRERLSRTKARERLSPAPVFILVEPQMGENIGACARVMLNFGVSGLRLVNPRDGWPNERAAAMASGAAVVVEGAKIFQTLDEALSDCHYVIAATARQRELSTPVQEPAEAATLLRDRIEQGQTCAIVLGGERNGLSTDDIARADAIVSIPVNPAFASLNLAQAAGVLAYEWSRTSPGVEQPEYDESNNPAGRDDVAGLVEHFEQELDAAGYFYPPEKKPLMARNLRAALTRAGFTTQEIHSLRGAIKALVLGRRGKR